MKKSFCAALFTVSLLTLPALRLESALDHPPGMLGVGLQEVLADTVASLDLPGEYGALVKGVGTNSPAAKAGIQDQDVIVSYNGQRVESARALQRMILETPAGRTVELRLIRNGKAVLVQPILGEGKMPETGARAPRSLGVGVENIAPAVGQYLGLEDGVGVIVRAIKENSPAMEADLKERDILVKINDTEITSATQLAEEIKGLVGYDAVLTLIRGTERRTVEVRF